jgi:SAM-dependent methyltransferase
MVVDLEAQLLREAITGGWRTRLIYEGVRSGLIDALREQPRSADALAAELGLHADTVFRVLRALATFGLCTHVSAREFAVTPLGARLATGALNSMRGVALHWGGRTMASLETIGDTLTTGEPGWGNGNFAGLIADPIQGDIFYRAMAEQSVPVSRALATAYDFSGFATVMDVGAGYGAVLAEILRANPAIAGVIYDLEGVGAGAQRFLDEMGVGDRVRFVPGSFFDAVPEGADCILLKFILHDWSDGDVATIMTNCRRALPAGGRIVIVEKLLPEIVGPADESAVRSDLVMMPINGKERTLGEYRNIAAAAGFAYRGHFPLVDECFAIEIEAVAIA